MNLSRYTVDKPPQAEVGQQQQQVKTPHDTPSPIVEGPSTPIAHSSLPLAPKEQQALAKWTKLTDHINHWFYKPDLQALSICLAAAQSQYDTQADPIWFFVLGPSGSGKTTIIINGLLGLPNAHLMGDLTKNALLSGWTGGKHPSLLHKIGSGLLLFKDFTTFLSKSPEVRAEIASQLREVYDGRYVKGTGKMPAGGKQNQIEWRGKITVIAAATPALERYWAIHRDLGERFLHIRWERKDGLELARWANKQRGHEREIADGIMGLAAEFFSASQQESYRLPELTEPQEQQLNALAEFCCFARGHVHRDGNSSRDIIDIAQVEDVSRLAKGVTGIARNHASLYHRASIAEADMQAAIRVAIDTVPITRSRALMALVHAPSSIGTLDLIEISNLGASTLRWVTDELEALGLIEIERSHNGAENSYGMSLLGRKLARLAFPS